ncbi:hypothetical protein niasHT_016839 [Heterodera trifolii]|uniref:Uncharacterized protein n=1 Tax=Heterodera trifolii TaxID=157864 RepID=A0ABD2KTX2_9BILA
MAKKRLPLSENQQPTPPKRKEMLPLQTWFGSDKQFVTFSVDGSTSPARKKAHFQTPISEDLRWAASSNNPSTSGDAKPNEKQTMPKRDGGSANASQQKAVVESVFCAPSQLQKNLHASVLYLMSLRDNEQQNLLRLLCNHPILLYQKVLEMSGDLQHKGTKRAKKEFVNFSGVICHFPTRYELCQCRIEDSGKLFKLFEIATERSTERLIVASNFVKTLDLLDSLFGLLRDHFVVFRINPNTPITALPQIEHQILEGAKGQNQIVLLSSKMERLNCELFHSARLIFFDFDPCNDGKTIRKWDTEGRLKSVQRLITSETFEANEFSLSDGDNSRPNSQPTNLVL